MPKEEHTSSDRSFDDLARAVAEGSLSRRRALKLFAGTAIAALIPSRALADDDCVHICHVPFDRQTGRCFFGQRENRCVPRSRLDEHRNHPCDCLHTRCRNCTRPTTTSTTSTTPMCIPNGGTCSTGGTPCCSGDCSADGFCACPSGYVRLSNGTCAKPCTSAEECSGCGSAPPFCGSDVSSPSGGYCSGLEAGQPCSSDIGCPAGQYCNAAGFCAAAC